MCMYVYVNMKVGISVGTTLHPYGLPTVGSMASGAIQFGVPAIPSPARK